MFLRQLEYLVALAQEEHFSRAAQSCNVSQPSLSNAIKQLEIELGTPIVLRHQRFQGFTSEGRRIVEWAKRILADRAGMLQELSVLKKNLTGRLRLGAMPTASPVLPFINRRFLEIYPEVRIVVSFLGLEELRVKLTNFDLDVGITYIDQKQPPPLVSFPLYKEHLGLLVPDDARFSKIHSMTWAAAAALPLCLLSPDMHERQIIDSAFASVGQAPTPRIESDSIVNLAFHTMQGGGVTVVPSHFGLLANGFPGTRILRLVEPEVVRQVGLVWVGGDPLLPLARVMLALLKELTRSGELALRTAAGPADTKSGTLPAAAQPGANPGALTSRFRGARSARGSSE
jgi:DNA-binding transcriptional LysR family regulator